MADDKDETTHAMVPEAADHVADDERKGVGVQADGAGEGLAAAGARLGLVAIGNGGGDKAADFTGDAFTDTGGQHHVNAEGQVRAVLLGGPERQEHGGAGGDLGLELGRTQFRDENAIDHQKSPSCSVHCRAAIGGKALAGDEAGGGGGEKGDDGGDLFGPADAA